MTTKYRIEKTKSQKGQRTNPKTIEKTEATDASTAPAPTADITFKTWDPASGVALKYRTNKAQEVGRLFGSLGRIGRGMTGTGDVMAEDTPMLDVPAATEEVSRTQSPAPGVTANGAGETAKNQAGGGGANKKKKKGKK